MHTIILGLTAAAALTVAAAPASAEVHMNGFVANGVQLKGANENGVKFNGAVLQGVQPQAVALRGETEAVGVLPPNPGQPVGTSPDAGAQAAALD